MFTSYLLRWVCCIHFLRALHNTVLAALLSTFRPRHLQEYTPCAFSLNALRLPHSAKPHQRTSFTCPFWDRRAVSFCCCYRRAPTGRYSSIAQGVSPGLIIGTHLLSPFRGGTSARVLGVVVALYCIYPLGHLRACVSAAPTELFILLFDIYPGFHIGLLPHFTLGYAGVPPLQGYSTTIPKSM